MIAGRYTYEDVAVLWDIGQKLNDERSAAARLRVLVASQRYQVEGEVGSAAGLSGG